MILPTTFVSAAKHYLAGVLSAAFNGGVAGLGGILGLTGMSLAGVKSVPLLDWHGMMSAFIGCFVLHGVIWLLKHPLPETYDTAAPFTVNAKSQTSSPADTPPTQQ